MGTSRKEDSFERGISLRSSIFLFKEKIRKNTTRWVKAKAGAKDRAKDRAKADAAMEPAPATSGTTASAVAPRAIAATVAAVSIVSHVKRTRVQRKWARTGACTLCWECLCLASP